MTEPTDLTEWERRFVPQPDAPPGPPEVFCRYCGKRPGRPTHKGTPANFCQCVPPAPSEETADADRDRLVAQTTAEERRMVDAMQAMQDDIAEILRALGLPDCARPYSPHEVVQRDILPALRAALLARHRDRERDTRLLDWLTAACRDLIHGENGKWEVIEYPGDPLVEERRATGNTPREALIVAGALRVAHPYDAPPASPPAEDAIAAMDRSSRCPARRGEHDNGPDCPFQPERTMNIPDSVQGEAARAMYEGANLMREEIKHAATGVKFLADIAKKKESTPAPNEDRGETIANLMLSYRHLEDASMRLGKTLQAIDGGESVYDKNTTVGA